MNDWAMSQMSGFQAEANETIAHVSEVNAALQQCEEVKRLHGEVSQENVACLDAFAARFGRPPDDPNGCGTISRVHDYVVSKTLFAAEAERKTHHVQPVYIADADEEGNFVFRNVRIGHYNILAFGRAGVNQALWLDEVDVIRGSNATIKVAHTISSCVLMK